MRIHFIAIGGAAMHSLAIALHRKGYHVTGSDDEIFNPARDRLQSCGLLPEREGWFPNRITPDIDAIVLGMHAHDDNPELQRAKELGITIYSYPEYLYEQSKHKTRVVVGGSHGKTTTTAMILHILQSEGIASDYMVGAQLEAFDNPVRLSDTAQVMVIEGDEYLTSPIDKTPKFHHYHPHIAVLTGIEWDHVNVFPTFDDYKLQFSRFIDLIEPDGKLFYCADDVVLSELVAANTRTDITKTGYTAVPSKIKPDGTTQVVYPIAPGMNDIIPIKLFGHHNLLNMSAALHVCEALGVDSRKSLYALSGFKGAANRLQLLKQNGNTRIFKDFAHAPSKVRATVHAVREQYPRQPLVACLELHTYSSLSAHFLPMYKDTMSEADLSVVYYSEHALSLKRLPMLDAEQVRQSFANANIKVYTDSDELYRDLRAMDLNNTNLLMMSSGNFNGIDLEKIID
ncbi:MAG: peptidoglycan synthetase [Bacteroidales bacterium]|nr:peptidoglycan synthetase [Candidatus Colimorpha onthohippi]